MRAILSCTEHDFYAATLPLVVWSWAKLGIDASVFIPADYGPKLSLAMTYCDPDTEFHKFTSEKHKEVTYAQVSRLFGWTLPEIQPEEVVITGDADLAVFNEDYFKNLDNGRINVVGADLLEESMKQYPMCFLAMSKLSWMEIFDSNAENGYQEFLDEHVGKLNAENFRGNFWSRDQWLAYTKIKESGLSVLEHPRAAIPNRWATRRADRDGWNFNPLDILDAHLPRPVMEENNWNKTMQLFRDIYPGEDLGWMYTYREKYLLL